MVFHLVKKIHPFAENMLFRGLTVSVFLVLTCVGVCAAVLKEKRWKIGSSRPSDAAPGGTAEAMDVS